jgi:hypothetical protein
MKHTLIFLAIFLLLASPAPVRAQGETPPQVDPNSMWGEVVDQSGNIRYDNLSDLGTVQESADWMPSIPGIGTIPASYHEYQTPSGNIIVLPTASTLFFMAINPQESGLAQSDSQLGMSGGLFLEAPGLIKGMLQGYIDPAAINSLGYTNQDNFFSDVIAGKQSIWSVMGPKTVDFLWDLANQSLTDRSIYTMVLLYTSGNCANVPGGCPQNANLPTPPLPPSCSTPIVQSGAITITARKVAPLNPIVVGQDTERRGADVTWEVRVEPTSYTYGVQVPVMGTVCVPWNGQGSSDCQTSDHKAGMLEQIVVRYDCEQYTQLFPETLNWVTASASLSQASRDWILNILSIHYPEAYLHHPSFSFPGNPSAGSFHGNTYVWTLTQNHVQIADPGYFNLVVAGSTTGTPVSSPRGFSRTGGQFGVYIKQIAIIQ